MWRKIKGFEVWEDGGYITRGTKADSNGSEVPAYVCRWDKSTSAWVKEDRITPAAFSAGVRRGTIKLI